MTSIGLAGAFLGGIATLLSPCAALLLPGFFATAFATRGRLLAKTVLFYLGLLLTLMPLGALAGSVGRMLVHYRSALITVSAVIIIALGIALAAGVTFRLPGAGTADRISSTQRRDATGSLAIFMLGATYGVAGGCSGPILGSVLAVAALGANALYGAALLAIYALGMLVPLVVLAALWDHLQLRRALRPRPITIGPITTTWMSLISGLLFIAIGILLLVTSGTQNLASLLDTDTQVALEATVQRWAAAIPDMLAWLILAAVIVAGLLIWALRREGRRNHRQCSQVER